MTIYFVYSSNTSNEEQKSFDDVLSEIKLVSTSLVSAGYPTDWKNESAIRIGLTNGNHVLDTKKLSHFEEIDYKRSKKLLGTSYDYLVFFEDLNESIIQIEGFCAKGKPGINITNSTNKCYISLNNTEIKHLVKINRYVAYKNNENNKSNIINMILYLWN